MDVSVSLVDNAPKLGCAPVTQDRAVTARKDRSEPLALTVQSRMTDRVDPAVDAVKNASGHAPLNRALRQTSPKQLAVRDHAVLTRRDCRDDPVGVAL